VLSQFFKQIKHTKTYNHKILVYLEKKSGELSKVHYYKQSLHEHTKLCKMV